MFPPVILVTLNFAFSLKILRSRFALSDPYASFAFKESLRAVRRSVSALATGGTSSLSFRNLAHSRLPDWYLKFASELWHQSELLAIPEPI